jgi:hypothetical protein
MLLLAFALVAHAQAGPDIFITPVAGAPFSAVIVVERETIQKDGSVVKVKSLRAIARDNKGRIHNEARTFTGKDETVMPTLIRVHLYDPETRLSTIYNPARKSYSTMTVAHPPSTEPPGSIQTSPMGRNSPKSQFTKEEDLGIRQLEGLPAHGLRETQRLPADEGASEATVVDESWYSNDLRINLKLRHDDLSKGSLTMTVTELNRAEPDHALFEVPEGYTEATRE